MGHYDQFEVRDTPRSRRNGSFVEQYNEKLDKKYSCLTPKGNTSDVHSTIDDALGFCNTGAKIVEDYPVKTFSECCKEIAKKETKHKVEGARYCYLSSIASASIYAGAAEDQIGKYLDELLDMDFRMECSTQHVLHMIATYCGMAIGSDKKLWDGVVRVRMQGLSSGKYTVGNHKLPMDKDLLLDAAARHLIAYLYIDPIDEESGENHLCHIMANLLMFSAQLNVEKGGTV